MAVAAIAILPLAPAAAAVADELARLMCFKGLANLTRLGGTGGGAPLGEAARAHFVEECMLMPESLRRCPADITDQASFEVCLQRIDEPAGGGAAGQRAEAGAWKKPEPA